MHPDIDRIAGELERLGEELNEVAMRILSEAIEAGGGSRPDTEKRVSQARRSVEKAVHHLRMRDAASSDD